MHYDRYLAPRLDLSRDDVRARDGNSHKRLPPVRSIIMSIQHERRGFKPTAKAINDKHSSSGHKEQTERGIRMPA
jgi:hypothetical protein